MKETLSSETVLNPVYKQYPLVTHGLDKEIDILGVCVQALTELDDLQRAGVVTYLANRFGTINVRS